MGGRSNGAIRKTGTEETRLFYEEVGWRVEGGKPIDLDLFGITENGPIRIELNKRQKDRLRSALSRVGTDLNLLECGCGGSPEMHILDLCSRYTGVDFSDRGLQLAQQSFSNIRIPYEFRKADVCALPFKDGEFDAVYSANMIYHIDDPESQNIALTEMARVVRPGGVLVLVAANPYPLLFPLMLARGIVRDSPFLGAALKRLRLKKIALPYKPMPIGWMRRRLARHGSVQVVAQSLPPTIFNRTVTELKGPGKLRWKIIRMLDLHWPRLSVYLGNYVMLITYKKDVAK